jgi:hypothetical protein
MSAQTRKQKTVATAGARTPRHSMPTDAEARAEELSRSPFFAELRADLEQELELGLRFVAEEEAVQLGHGTGIQTWLEPEPPALCVSVKASSRIEDVLRFAVAAYAQLQDFPRGEANSEEQALVQAYAYTYAAGALSTRPALLQLGRNRDLLSKLSAAGALGERQREDAARNIWAALTPLGVDERQIFIEQFERMDPRLGELLAALQRRWGLLAPATATAAQRMLDDEPQ